MSYSTEQQLISEIFQQENSISVKVNSITKLFKNFFTQDEQNECYLNTIFNQILPEIINIQQQLYEHNQESMENFEDESCDEIFLNILKQYLQMSMELHHVMYEFISWLATKGPLDIKLILIPINFNSFLFLTLMHCKYSNETYKNCFEQLEEITELFKLIQQIQPKLLCSIETQFTFDLDSNTSQQDDLIKILDGICNIGNIFFGMNSKSMALAWRSYHNLIKRYGTSLNQYDPMKPLKLIFNEVTSAFTIFLESNEIAEEKSFKIHNFLLSIGRTVMLMFWDICCNDKNKFETMDLLIRLYKPGAEAMNISELNAQLFETHIYSRTREVLCRILLDPNVFAIDKASNSWALLKNIAIILPYARIFNLPHSTHTFLNLFFGCLNKLNNTQHSPGFTNSSNYNKMLINFVISILPLPEDEYYNIEEILLNNLLEASEDASLFAHDLWLRILQSAPPTLCFDTLTLIIGKYKENTLHEFRPGVRHLLRSFLGHCYAIMPDSLQEKFLEMYIAEDYINLWGICGIRTLPPRKQYLTQVIAVNICKRSSSLNNSLEYVMDAFDVLSNLMAITTTQQQSLTNFKDSTQDIQSTLNDLVTSLWRSDVSLLTNEMYAHFLTNSLIPMMNVFITSLRCNSQHLLQILLQLKENSIASPVKIITAQILLAIAKTPPNEYNAMTFSAIGALLNTFPSNQNSECEILNLYANQVRTAFEDEQWRKNLNNVHHEHLKAATTATAMNEEIATEVKKRREELQSELEPKKKMKLAKASGFSSCGSRNSSESQGASVSDEAQDVLDNMKDEVKQLLKLAANGKWGKVSQENSRSMFYILNKLKTLMYRS